MEKLPKEGPPLLLAKTIFTSILAHEEAISVHGDVKLVQRITEKLFQLPLLTLLIKPSTRLYDIKNKLVVVSTAKKRFDSVESLQSSVLSLERSSVLPPSILTPSIERCLPNILILDYSSDDFEMAQFWFDLICQKKIISDVYTLTPPEFFLIIFVSRDPLPQDINDVCFQSIALPIFSFADKLVASQITRSDFTTFRLKVQNVKIHVDVKRFCIALIRKLVTEKTVSKYSLVLEKLIFASRLEALTDGFSLVLPDHVHHIAHNVLRHKIHTKDPDNLITEALKSVPIPI